MVPITPQEKDVLNRLMEDNSQLTDLVPAEGDHSELIANLHTCCKAMVRVEQASATLKPLIGRMLYIVKQNPSLYKNLGHATFDEFVTKEVINRYKMSHGSVWEAKKIVESFPGLTMQEYRDIGTTKLVMAAKVTDHTSPNHTRILEKAKGMSIKAFKQDIIEQGLVDKGDTQLKTLVITGTRNQIEEIEAFLNNDQVGAYCNTSDSAAKICCAIEECQVEWTTQMEEQQRSRTAEA